MPKLILIQKQSLGDIIATTALIRDLQKTHPGKYQVSMRTPFPTVFNNNPYLTQIEENDEQAWKIELHYPAINSSNQSPRHFYEAFHTYLGEQLNINIPITKFSGDIHLSDEEKNSNIIGKPYWIVNFGFKRDYTLKEYIDSYAQEVITKLKDRITFVQIGHASHYHPKLDGVINMIGQTNDFRKLCSLVYHSSGCVSLVSMLQLMANSVPTKTGAYRPCVTIAGGREPAWWSTNLPGHQVLQSVGTLPCCDMGACWKSRTHKLHDGDNKDNSTCTNTVMHNGRPVAKCMYNIKPQDIIRGIEKYYEGGVLQYGEII